jgi:uncharacterized protein
MTDFDTYHRNFRMMLALFGLWMVSMLVFQFIVMTAFIAVAINLDVAINYFLHQSVPDFSIAQQRLLNVVGLPFTFILPAIIVSRINNEPANVIIGSYRRPPSTLLVLGFAAIILCLPFIYMTNEVNQNLPLPDFAWELEKAAEKIQTDMFEEQGVWAILGNVLLIVIIAPMSEEIFFRGALQRTLVRMTGHPHIPIILAAFAFSAIHMEFAGFIPRLVLGMMLGYMASWSGNIIIPIFCHAVFNGGQLALVYMLKQEVISDPENVSVPIYLSIFSLVITTLVLRQFYTRTIIKSDIPE